MCICLQWCLMVRFSSIESGNTADIHRVNSYIIPGANKHLRTQLNSRESQESRIRCCRIYCYTIFSLWLCISPTIEAFIRSNPFIRRWYMIHFVFIMYVSICSNVFQLNSKELQESQIRLMPTITVVIQWNPFIGRWDIILPCIWCILCICSSVFGVEFIKIPENCKKGRSGSIFRREC
jgi:hypothetical protein